MTTALEAAALDCHLNCYSAYCAVWEGHLVPMIHPNVGENLQAGLRYMAMMFPEVNRLGFHCDIINRMNDWVHAANRMLGQAMPPPPAKPAGPMPPQYQGIQGIATYIPSKSMSVVRSYRLEHDPGSMTYSPVEQYGATCKRCNEYNEYAVASTSFTCWSCRNGQ